LGKEGDREKKNIAESHVPIPSEFVWPAREDNRDDSWRKIAIAVKMARQDLNEIVLTTVEVRLEKSGFTEPPFSGFAMYP
jgi:hypothetical protein